jgi:hypothetical protein
VGNHPTAGFRLNDVPQRGDAKAIPVNWLMIEVRDAAGKAI